MAVGAGRAGYKMRKANVEAVYGSKSGRETTEFQFHKFLNPAPDLSDTK